jgi:hypothetical protein
MTMPAGGPVKSGSGDVPDAGISPGKLPCKTLEDARREILRLACENSAAITLAVIKDALQGRYQSAKFLFETVGLARIDGDEVDDPERHESLASLLLKGWQLAPEASSITEVPEVTPGVAPANKAPVES